MSGNEGPKQSIKTPYGLYFIIATTGGSGYYLSYMLIPPETFVCTL